MATILGANGIQLNYNAGSTPNAGTRIFLVGKAVPGTNVATTIIRFTNSGGASNFSLYMRINIGAGRQSGTFAENWWIVKYAGYASTGTGWTQNFATDWVWDGNAIIGSGFSNSGTYVEFQATQGDTGAYVEGYVEVQCNRWDQITVSY